MMEEEVSSQKKPAPEAKTSWLPQWLSSLRASAPTPKHELASNHPTSPNKRASIINELRDEFMSFRRRRNEVLHSVKEDDPNKYSVLLPQKPRLDVEWCEHVTIGDPFLNGCNIQTSCVKGYNFAENMPMSRFKHTPLLAEIDKSQALTMPALGDNSIQVEECTTLLCDPKEEWNWFLAKNEKLGYELEYNWNSNVWPWLVVWTEHNARSLPPWNSKTRTRGLEFSTKPFPLPSLEKFIPKERLGQINSDKTLSYNVNTFDGTPINFVLPKNGRTEVFSFRWNYLGCQ
ncbi:hypothetical protein RFI_31965 [Reticulomyxa filosa]|uniref:Uncharacterized protein n=1 Tax=Reticulomyxa filosa TaxID=46433 RepID=X6LVQ8_RETFI|nr:hypothetical protein RFI_31965 [Reticulomyxa filosa]|eukprot:ETO05431.1 hypothetical protein RFI_31965 [Reticulomyxa filosa]